jgi:polyketide synthase PksN
MGTPTEKTASGMNTAIAVIGMSCRFPGAADYKAFWENLKKGKSSITEVPSSRWDWEAFWGDPKTETNKSNSKWGGFLEGVDHFDPAFFGLSPREVERMDPQQRIMLELTWSCFEDAAVRPSGLSGKKVGVFLGVFNFDYKELQERNNLLSIEAHHSTGTAAAIIANRVSYYFNFKGPSISMDTACSSSLNAIHAAIQSLLQGESTVAVAGGINLLLTPTRHISFSKTGMLSPTGSSKTFDDSADGYVRGEGAGLILLKPLEQALLDNDHIYGVIKGTAVNHGGKTYSLTYPNPEAQKEVILQAQKMAGIHPSSISYMEAHGTGTPKGDPIEFQGLTAAFNADDVKDAAKKKSYCGLGSVKTNIGHLEAAAGIAGVIKVLLSMQYRQLPGLQNFKTLNHRIVLKDTPFYLVTDLKEWKPLKDAQNKELPRRAGVSSFGFGGTNAHVVLEEAPTVEKAAIAKRKQAASPYYMICLSAKTNESLLQKEKDLAVWIDNNQTPLTIADICRTLSTGREHFQKRAVIIADSVEELRNKLGLMEMQPAVDGCYRNIDDEKSKAPVGQLLIEMGNLVSAALSSKQKLTKAAYYQKLTVLAELYVKGYEPDWEKPWYGSNGRRIALPAYPFAREAYWIPELETGSINHQHGTEVPLNLHPLLGENTSTLLTQKFSTVLTGQEFFLKDHIVKGKSILPAVAYLEMIRMAILESTRGIANTTDILCLKNIIWAQPIVVEDNKVVIETALFAEAGNNIGFEVFSTPSDTDKQPVVYSKGTAYFENPAADERLTIPPILQLSNMQQLSGADCYRLLADMGFNYGPAHQALDSIYAGEAKVLARLLLPVAVKDTLADYGLHPAMMDAALQAVLLMNTVSADATAKPATYLPFALEQLEIIAPCTEQMWAFVQELPVHLPAEKRSNIKTVAIDLCDETGRLCVRMKGCSFKLAPSAASGQFETNTSGTLLLQPEWREKIIPEGMPIPDYRDYMVFLCEPPVAEQGYWEKQLPGIQLTLLQDTGKNIATRYQDYAATIFEAIQQLLKDKTPRKILLQVIVFDKEANRLFAGLSGMLKTAHLENPNITGQIILLDAAAGIAEKLKENAAAETDTDITYINNKRNILCWKEVNTIAAAAHPWKPGGVYLITGGAGGLGLIFAKEIVSAVKNPVLILLGRSPLSESKAADIAELRKAGATVAYRQADITDSAALTSLIHNIQTDFNGLDGIIHSAGIIQDDFIIRKTKEAFRAVCLPKVSGLTILDEVTKDIPLDFFVSFSSVVAALGNPGQADYAAANGYMDAYMVYRNSLRADGKRYGQSISVNWPLWKEGGMQLTAPLEKEMLEQMGMQLLETGTAISSFYEAMASQLSQVMIASGKLSRLKEKLLTPVTAPVLLPPAQKQVIVETGVKLPGVTKEMAVNYFKELLSVTVKRSAEQIDADTAMEAYGIDSVMVMQMTNQMETVFGSLPKTLFFEYQNITELSQYFLDHYAAKLEEILQPGLVEAAVAINEEPEALPVMEKPLLFRSRIQPRLMESKPVPQQQQPDTRSGALDIAIIGVAGRYPQADNLQEFWDNLRGGKDCITEIPSDRWDYRLYFNEDKEHEGTSYSKWGGFINDVDKFDPLFFNITPFEAERMDPQERLFLQCVYEAMEDAGYTRQTIAKEKYFGLGNQVGVYVGVMYEEYQLFGAQETLHGRPVALWGLPSSIANRVSYFFDFHGPSMAIDTMCSSSLTAIHLACESIVRGKCEVAIAGGVNVSVHPNKYLFLSQGRFASSKGRCESFGIGGDGYVPGEGVGAVLLKPLEKAIADGDNIYGVIKSTAVNHGGKNNGFTVPNPNAQAATIGSAFAEAGIDPRTMSYFEAHGTGTSLGDPIEILGLVKAIQPYTSDCGFCSIGSAKSNIGHCESAAGIAGVTKVLLQMKHKQVVPSLHSAVLNTNIDFAGTPFIVQQQLALWNRPVLEKDGQTKEYLRCAGISSFGAGGSNAHIIIEEYDAAFKGVQQDEVSQANGRFVILLSAKDEERLQVKVKQLLSVLQPENKAYWNITDTQLADVSYTLQVGRDHLETRLALLVNSVEELAGKLAGFIAGTMQTEGLLFIPRDSKKSPGIASGEAIQSIIKKHIEKKEYEALAALWVNGVKVNWKEMYSNTNGLHRISLPAYPFVKERYWIGESNNARVPVPSGATRLSFLHPLLHENSSDLAAQRFSVRFSGNEFFLADHRVNGRKVLPASAYLEMIHQAVLQSVKSFSFDTASMQMEHISWLQPLFVEDNDMQVHIELYMGENEVISFEVYQNDQTEAGEREVFCQGAVSFSALPGIQAPGETDIKALQQICNNRIISPAHSYEAFEKAGLEYGASHQGLEQVYIGHNLLLAKIKLPDVAADGANDFFLHPALLDAALQASLWWNSPAEAHAVEMLLPVEVAAVQVCQPIPAVAWVVMRNDDHQAAMNTTVGTRILNIDLLSETGQLCVRLTGMVFKSAAHKALAVSAAENNFETLLFVPRWKQKEIHASHTIIGRHLIILCGFENSEAYMAAQFPAAEIIVFPSFTAGQFQQLTLSVFERVQALLREKEKTNMLVQVLLPFEEETKLLSGIGGLLKTAQKENPGFSGQLIQVSATEPDAGIEIKIRENIAAVADQEIRYTAANREVLAWELLADTAATSTEMIRSTTWREQGVYLITGGAGGLGYIFAREIAAATKQVTLVLTGRSEAGDAIKIKIASLQQPGITVVYYKADVGDMHSVQILISNIKHQFGGLTGIIHSAGVVQDHFLLHKNADQWNTVLTPKVAGIQNLDLASRDEQLDLFIVFSSVTGALGNAGQADYATANAFMDEYASYRNTLVAKGLRKGHTLSVNWPLWKEGGMQINKDAENYLYETMGMIPLPTDAGIHALYTALLSKQDRVMVGAGNREKMIEKIILREQPLKEVAVAVNPTASPAGQNILDDTILYFKKLLSSIVKLPVDKIKPEMSMEEYGIDSVMVMRMNSKLEKVFGSLSRTLFFEYQNIKELAQFFVETYYPQLCEILGIAAKPETGMEAPIVQPGAALVADRPVVAHNRRFRSNAPQSVVAGKQEAAALSQDIAIVGLSGRYPQADNLEQFWENLSAGKDCVTEIPEDRWDYRLYFDADKSVPGKTYSKWGGFMNGVDRFDPLFFNISPREAELLDPQERIFLQCVYETIEDAGYNRQVLSAAGENGLAGNVGVFVGVMYGEYQLYGAEQTLKGNNTALFGTSASIANRISYFYNFDGPSMAIDTMCSSSLTAIHLACQAIRNNDCKAAIAGGVNISIHPNKYLLLAQGKFISSKGRCESFGIGGDGYVPGEGVGAVLLKPLSAAIADGDHIYGVIKTTAVNHGGKTNGYTVPNPNAQAKVIKKAFDASGIDPRTISYLEAHGTGTSLGDPIEITGLKKAYREFTEDNQFCTIGSVKSNIGHAESAAGIAGITKVLLQLKHKQIVPSLHSKELNPNIDFQQSPFIVQQTLTEWKRPVIGKDQQAKEYLRRAGISSFGAGGANAHIIIEEFDESILQADLLRAPVSSVNNEPVVVLLSAKNLSSLKELTGRWLAAIQKGTFKNADLFHIAYTLQTGRDALDTRMAMIVKTIDELSDRLTAFLKTEAATEEVFYGKIERDNIAIDAFAADEELKEAVVKWMSRKKYHKLCDFWVKGLQVDWMYLYTELFTKGIKPKRMSLPLYPFEQERCWVPELSTDSRSDAHPIAPGVHKAASLDTIGTTGSSDDIVLLQPYWKEAGISVTDSAKTISGHTLIFIGRELKRDDILAIEESLKGVQLIQLTSQHQNPATRFQEYALQVFSIIQDLLNSKPTGNILLQVIIPNQMDGLNALHALLKTAQQENPLITGQLIEAGIDTSLEYCMELIKQEAVHASPVNVKYAKTVRQFLDWKPLETEHEIAPLLWKKEGVYLLTGGAGEIGFVFGEEIAKQAEGTILIFTGRSVLTDHKLEKIKLLEAHGATVVYKQADITQEESVAELIQSIVKEHGTIDGIIHSAGVKRDRFLLHKTRDEWEEVLAPKVRGLINLDEATKQLPLDFFIVFSSIAGALGNAGQADYATANAFMDAFIESRDHMVKNGLRSGRSITINWPLWKEGGMHVASQVEEAMEEQLGIKPLKTAAAIKAFYRAVAAACKQVMIVYGDKKIIAERLFRKIAALPVHKSVVKHSLVSGSGNELLQKETLLQLKTLFGKVVKLHPDRINDKEDLQAYGLNSVMIVQLNQLLEKIFGELSKTLFYEYQDLSGINSFLVNTHPDTCMQWCGLLNTAPADILPESVEDTSSKAASPQPDPEVRMVELSQRGVAFKEKLHFNEPIAIIGMSGRYPMANSLEAYWENLMAGKDCISEVPEGRWSLDGFFHADKKEAIESLKSYSKWGGFLEDFSAFDPLFFNISPREAVTMDPQERIFLQASWQAFEDAGYTKEQLAEQFNSNIGVFAGVTKTGFELYSPELWKSGDEHMLRTSFSSIANRVSFHLNLKGPSMPVDTMCSSSLTAIHEACENLLRGTCDMAIAGGVNLYLHPLNYIGLCSQSFLSTDGKCRSFGKGGSGFVPGEGVGVLLLKPLSRAIADGDHIYALVKGTSINHGGKTSGYTVPNPVAQAELIRKALDNAGINARDISYIEAHGTGTFLGDPIEIAGLSTVFRQDTAATQFCAIGSAKSNIGHLEAAAGIAGVTKMILQMKHGMLVPSLHAGELNANINFEKSPFFVQKALTPWNRPVIEKNGIKQTIPRIGGISSFGAGGANAHLILEEYIPQAFVETGNASITPANLFEMPVLLVLSARDEKRLTEQVKQLLDLFIKNQHSWTYKYLLDIAFTLQTGRESMEERLAVLATSGETVVEKLTDFLAGKKDITQLFRGSLADKYTGSDITEEGFSRMDTISKWIENKQYEELLNAWTKGDKTEWIQLYDSLKGTEYYPSRISLPTYPFAKTIYWLPETLAGSVARHDLIDSKKSNGSLSQPVEPEPEPSAKEWFFYKKEWEICPPDSETDWNKNLLQHADKNIYIFYETADDCKGFKKLLGKLEIAAGMKQPLKVTTLQVDHINAAVLKDNPPDIILFLGAAKITDDSLVPVENDLKHVFELSKNLMKAIWGNAVQIYYFYETSDVNQRLDIEALSGFLRSAMKENDLHRWKSVRVHNAKTPMDRHKLFLKEWLSESSEVTAPVFIAIQYAAGQRFLRRLIEIKLNPPSVPAFRTKGNYLIAGGTGYVGGLLMEEMARKYQATLIIIARSPYNEERQQQVKMLEELGATVYYHVADITDMTALQLVYQTIKEQVGAIHGVINLVRSHESKSIASKSWESFHKVSRVKVEGTLNLDLLTQAEPLHVFMLFGSIGAYGARGDADYAFSVAYQSAFARHRNRLLAQGLRNGIAVSQCWGPWVEDKLFPESRKQMKSLGLDLIDMESAFPFIEASCFYNDSVVGLCTVLNKEKVKEVIGMEPGGEPENTIHLSLPVPGRFETLIEQWEQQSLSGKKIDIALIQQAISLKEVETLDISLVERIYKLCFQDEIPLTPSGNHSSLNSNASEEKLRQETFSSIMNTISTAAMEVLQIERADENQPLQNYGLDSIMAMRLSVNIGKKLKREILPQWFIEFSTLKELAQYLTGLNNGEPSDSPHPVNGIESTDHSDTEITKLIRELVIQVLQVEHLDNEKSFQDYGLDSIMAMRLSTSLEKRLKKEISPFLLIEFPTVKGLSEHLKNTFSYS